MSEHSKPIDVLAAGLRHAALRQQVAAGNLANLHTPGFKAKEVKFNEAFSRALESGNREAATSLKPELIDQDRAANANGNNVDLETEVMELQDAGVQHRALVRLINLALTCMRLAAGGGG